MGDDRAYTIAMLAWYLQQKRRNSITNKQSKPQDISKFLLSRKPQLRKR